MGLLNYKEKKKANSDFGINDFVDGMKRIQEHFFNPEKPNWKIWNTIGVDAEHFMKGGKREALIQEELGVTEVMVDKFLRTPISAIKNAYENPTDDVLESFERVYGWPLNVNDPNLKKHAESDFKHIGRTNAAFGTDWLIEGDDDIDIEMGDTWDWRTVNYPIYPEEFSLPEFHEFRAKKKPEGYDTMSDTERSKFDVLYEKRRVRRPRPTSYTSDNYIYGRPVHHNR